MGQEHAAARIKAISEERALDRIVETVQRAEPTSAPFALVLGSGFSHGLVPTVREFVEVSLPLWIKANSDATSFEKLKKIPEEECRAIAREFWANFLAYNQRDGLQLELDPHSGLPSDSAAVYRAAFDSDSDYSGAVGEPAQARKFQRVLIGIDRPRLNAAHFLLASLLGV